MNRANRRPEEVRAVFVAMQRDMDTLAGKGAKTAPPRNRFTQKGVPYAK